MIGNTLRGVAAASLTLLAAGCSNGSDAAAPADVGKDGGAGGHFGDASSPGGHTSRDSAADTGTFDPSGGPTDPIPTKAREWVWVPFPDAKCRDGSTAGIELSANPASDNLLIYLEGGGSCWNQVECAGNPTSFVPPPPFGLAGGIFNRTNSANPVKDWNMVYVPYCTGDLHAGNNPGGDPGDGIGPQQFVGYTNLEKFLARVVPTFPNVKKILHTGVSAGGAGALLTAGLVAKTFPSGVDVIWIDDSAPPLSNPVLPSCIQRKKWPLWGFDKTFLADCGADCPNPDDYFQAYARHLAMTPGMRGGLIEAEADAIILGKYGYTVNDCTAPITQAPPPLDAATFKTALLDLRAQMSALVPDGGTPSFGTFYVPGSAQHGWLGAADPFDTATADGVKLVDWLADIIDGAAPTNVGL